jgi:hypothetical protein
LPAFYCWKMETVLFYTETALFYKRLILVVEYG